MHGTMLAMGAHESQCACMPWVLTIVRGSRLRKPGLFLCACSKGCGPAGGQAAGRWQSPQTARNAGGHFLARWLLMPQAPADVENVQSQNKQVHLRKREDAGCVQDLVAAGYCGLGQEPEEITAASRGGERYIDMLIYIVCVIIYKYNLPNSACVFWLCSPSVCLP